jgi:hypothetical protein
MVLRLFAGWWDGTKVHLWVVGSMIGWLLNDFGLVVFLVVMVGRLNGKPWMIGWFFDRLIE